MFTIKAYTTQGSTNIFEATELRIPSNRKSLEFIRPGNDLVECLLIDSSIENYSTVFIENSSGKTIEAIK